MMKFGFCIVCLKVSGFVNIVYGRMARGDHGLSKYHQGPPSLTFLCPAGGPPLKLPNSRFGGGLWSSSTTLSDTPRRRPVPLCNLELG
jgi:hypothetical protein